MLEATEEDACISRLGTGKTLRCFRFKLADMWDKAGMSYLPMPYQSALTGEFLVALEQAGKYDYTTYPVGQICGMIKEIKSAKQVFDEMVEGAINILNEFSQQSDPE